MSALRIVPVLLAGGKGERFWPLSRTSRPKQLLPLISNRSMIEETLLRIKPVCHRGVKPLIVTSSAIAGAIRRSLGARIAADMLVEPQGKDTAPAIVLAAMAVQARYGESIMAVLAADHAISPRAEYIRAVKYAAQVATDNNSLVVFGIPPSRPDVGYGYVEVGEVVNECDTETAYRANRFVEKPDWDTAVEYCKSGTYLWNSGMFVWKTSTILEEYRQHMPALYKQAAAAAKAKFSRAALAKFYGACERKSVDYGIMERSKRVAVVSGHFLWDDVGSWNAVTRVRPGNQRHTTVVGPHVFERNCAGSIIFNESHQTVAAMGLDNMVLVVTGDAVLAMPRTELPKMKEYLAAMKEDGRIPHSLF